MTDSGQKIFIIVSPNFPSFYEDFAVALKERGFLVLGIGDEYPEKLSKKLNDSLTEYCRVWDLNNIDWMIRTVDYLSNKYGYIDFIESNNEYWLSNDSILRQWFNIKSGLFPDDLKNMQSKSAMKKFFDEAGVKFAKYHLSDDYESTNKWAKEVGYPIFVKPNLGVGSVGTKKIKNPADLKDFYEKIDNSEYIFEEFIDGNTISYDGIVNSKGEIIFENNDIFTVDNATLVNDDLDDFFYVNKTLPQDLKTAGRKIIKAFNLKSRAFHLEFFRLKNDSNLGKKDELYALEINLRMGGANVPYVISESQQTNVYNVFADMYAYDENRQEKPKNKYFACSIGRKSTHHYVHSTEEIKTKFEKNISQIGEFPKEIAADAGDWFIVAKFSTLEKMNEFAKFVLEQK